jgi:serine/threonine-protein kinase
MTTPFSLAENVEVGAYRLLRPIGAGGMGAVWLAEHKALRRRAAVKVLHATFSSQPAIVARFFNEARAATAISDPGIVQIFDFGTHVDGNAYIVMELLDGEALDRRLERLGALPVAESLRIMRQVATSLSAAHGCGIIHRDLKPENIFLVRDAEVLGGERAKILDFGIAKLADGVGVKTVTSAVMGTPMFMSPEQCRGAGEIDARSDIYSLGCVLFTLLAGRPPFDAAGAGDIIAMHLREPPPRLSSVVAGTPHALDELVARCLAKDPAERFATAADLAVAIARIHPTGEIQPDHRSASRSTPTTLSSMAMQVARPARAKRRWIIAAALAVAGGAATFAIASSRSSSQDERIEPAAPSGSAVAREPDRRPAPPPPAPREPEPRVDSRTETSNRIALGLAAFVAWTKRHAGAPCPTAAQLDLPSDAWGAALRVTCTDQPSEEMIGILSAGPDGQFGTDDDIASWQLDRSITAVVHGPRWRATPAKQPARRPPAPAPTPQPAPPTEIKADVPDCMNERC